VALFSNWGRVVADVRYQKADLGTVIRQFLNPVKILNTIESRQKSSHTSKTLNELWLTCMRWCLTHVEQRFGNLPQQRRQPNLALNRRQEIPSRPMSRHQRKYRPSLPLAVASTIIHLQTSIHNSGTVHSPNPDWDINPAQRRNFTSAR